MSWDYVQGSHHKTRAIDLYFVAKIFHGAREKLTYLHLWKVISISLSISVFLSSICTARR
jgi:hypothetical protein